MQWEALGRHGKGEILPAGGLATYDDPMGPQRLSPFRPTIAALALTLAFGGCASQWKRDEGPLPKVGRAQPLPEKEEWLQWGKLKSNDLEPLPDSKQISSTVSIDEIEQAIFAFQAQRRGSGPALDSAWPPFIETVAAYLDQAPERLSLSPLIRARVAAEYELDRERRRALGTPPELDLVVARMLIRIDRKMRALRTLATSAAGLAPAKKQEGLAWPLTRGIITSGFGTRRDPIQTSKVRFHAGIDLSAPTNEPVYAAAAGRILEAGWQGSAGRAVRIWHKDGQETLYGHLSMIMVKEGQQVKVGDVIGLLGSSGRATGPHLHFAVYLEGKPVDPLDHLSEVPMSFSGDMPGIVFGWGE
jgi:murein DD-endopeptidase MepM/ murein hydrolase activator NlpD